MCVPVHQLGKRALAALKQAAWCYTWVQHSSCRRSQTLVVSGF